ncbi:hypothetical protein CN335_23915 [Bacillus thuringiensis]|nr:hypothetical protein BK762_00390 [Bacillus thuringiensis serovar toumanoffi]PFF31951.1 hypothetical protein CN335_23915 [Bacillus thuringiensis]PFT07646.1 hypothetical protein COK83_27845 [Bacillus thuringiensis]RFB50993.1 hypothetical protein DZB90_32795 [Bacillus thuringiensis]
MQYRSVYKHSLAIEILIIKGFIHKDKKLSEAITVFLNEGMKFREKRVKALGSFLSSAFTPFF